MKNTEIYENPHAEVVLLSTQTNVLAASDEEDQGEWDPQSRSLNNERNA